MVSPSVSLSTVQQVITYALQTFPSAQKRIERAAVLVATGAVEKIDDTTYLIRSQSDPSVSYAVAPNQCSCVDRQRHPAQRCKHEWAARIMAAAIRDEQRLALATYDVIAEAERVALGVA